MTTIATDGRFMAGDGLVSDHCDTIVASDAQKVFRLKDGRVVGGAGNRADVTAWVDWLDAGKEGDCPISGDRFSGLILNVDGSVLWVDHKGREQDTPTPCAVGTGQDYAYGAMEAGASALEAVEIACRRDLYSGGSITVFAAGVVMPIAVEAQAA
jgi:ATP-dependent protease HslVU (ClpYQ) peptidase subunit